MSLWLAVLQASRRTGAFEKSASLITNNVLEVIFYLKQLALSRRNLGMHHRQRYSDQLKFLRLNRAT